MRYLSHRRIKGEKLELGDNAQLLCIILINKVQLLRIMTILRIKKNL